MSESFWQTSGSYKAMAAKISGKWTDLFTKRKLQLWTIRCCKLTKPFTEVPACNELLVLESDIADRCFPRSIRYGTNHNGAWRWRGTWMDDVIREIRSNRSPLRSNVSAVNRLIKYELTSRRHQWSDKDKKAKVLQFADNLRDIFADPCLPVVWDRSWETEIVTSLVSGISKERAFDRVPILADALEEGGCDDQQVLNHCRSNITHGSGCWVVDIILGRHAEIKLNGR